MNLSIIIVNWNSKEYVRKCLITIAEHQPDIDYEILVIDSGSFDGCGDLLAREFPSVRFIQSQENLGFAKSNNLAVKQSRGTYLLFLNPDTEVTSGAIATLYSAYRGLASAGIVGATLLNSDGTLQTSCIQAFPSLLGELLNSEYLRRRFPRAPLWGMAPLFAAPKQIAPVEMVSGACMLVSRELFNQVHGFSEDFFMYLEDVDLCFKIHKANRINYYIPNAIITHHGGGSSRQISNFAAVNRSESMRTYFRKWKGSTYSNLYRFNQCLCATIRIALLTAAKQASPKNRKAPKIDAAVKKWKAIANWSHSTSTKTS